MFALTAGAIADTPVEIKNDKLHEKFNCGE